jgi:hypothetical protein
MNTYAISKENQNHELQNIKTILQQNNDYPPHTYINTNTTMNTSSDFTRATGCKHPRLRMQDICSLNLGTW